MSASSGTRAPSTARFPARARVRKRVEFLSIQERGQRVSTPRFVLILSLRAGLAPDANLARLGITASRKVGSAVVRNRAKRLIREAFRTTRELWPPELDLVVIVKRSLDDAKLDGVVAEFHAARAQIERKLAQLRAQGEIKKAPRA